MAFVNVEMHGAVALVTLNNPAQYNALAPELMRDLNAALDVCTKPENARAIVLTGAGKGFCAGAQFGGQTFELGDQIGPIMRDMMNPLIYKMRESAVPIVTAVNGPAAGGGVGLALAGDIVLAAKSAKFILTFARLGAALDGGASQILPQTIGFARARAMALLAEPVSGEQAAEWGMVWKCVEDLALMDEAMALARKLADGPPLALARMKRQLDSAQDLDLRAVLEMEAQAQADLFTTRDLREGAAAHVEKRAPKFTGA